jgi:hypothetical protein
MLQLVAGRTTPNARLVSQQPSSQASTRAPATAKPAYPQSILKSRAITGYEGGPGRHAEHRVEDSHNGKRSLPTTEQRPRRRRRSDG